MCKYLIAYLQELLSDYYIANVIDVIELFLSFSRVLIR